MMREHHDLEIGRLYRATSERGADCYEVVRVVAIEDKSAGVEVETVVPSAKRGSADIGKRYSLSASGFTFARWWKTDESDIDERDTKPFCALSSFHVSGTTTRRIRTPSGIALVVHDREGNVAAVPSGTDYFGRGTGDQFPDVNDIELARAWLLEHSSHRCDECGRHTFVGLTRFARSIPDAAQRELDTAAKLRARGICSSCEYWLDYAEKRDNPSSVRINGTHYWIEPDSRKPGWGDGYGGRRFVILFEDGRRVETRNLWCQDTIPRRFCGRLPDNARFEKEGERPCQP